MVSASYLRDFLEGKPLRQAAVLVLTYQQAGKDHLVLTRRTEAVEHHKGQISFPGGAFDPDDSSLRQTALRETQEEIGIDPQSVTIIQTLNPRPTPTGFQVTPFVGKIPIPTEWHTNRHEIAEVFTVPTAHFQNPAHLTWHPRKLDTIEYLDPLFRYHHYEIWGLTARILCELFHHPFPPEAL